MKCCTGFSNKKQIDPAAKAGAGGAGTKNTEGCAAKDASAKVDEIRLEEKHYEAHSDEEEDDDDDVMSDSEFLKQNPGGRQNQMRTSVSAEAYGVWNKKGDYVPPVFPKSDEQKQRLSQTLSKSFMFGALSKAEMSTIVDAMKEVSAKKGERLIKLGDAGDYLFVIEKGELECRKEINGVDTLLKRVEEGDVFGELALLYNCTRAANVDACDDCVLWKLDRNTFVNVVAGSAQKKREKYEGFLGNVPLLQHMDKYSRSQLCDGLRAESYPARSTIIKEGDEGHSFFIIENGSATAVKIGMEDKALQYNQGDFFGELSLLHSMPRAATVTAISDVDVLVLDRQAFKRLFGGSEKLKEAMKKEY